MPPYLIHAPRGVEYDQCRAKIPLPGSPPKGMAAVEYLVTLCEIRICFPSRMREDDQPTWLRSTAAATADYFIHWWNEATGPINWNYHLTPFDAIRRRVMLWAPVAVIAFIIFGAMGFHVLAGWRAGKLADRAMFNARMGNLPVAKLQIVAAQGLRPNDPRVRDVRTFIQSCGSDPAALERWEQLAAERRLTDEEILERARLSALRGTDEQFETALTALERTSNHDVEAASFRSARALRRGNLASSIEQARVAAAKSDDPEKKIELLKLLLTNFAPVLNTRGAVTPESREAAQEVIALVDQLQQTPLGQTAIAMTLGSFPLPRTKTNEWTAIALRDLRPDNPALLPAAQFLVATRAGTAREYYAQLFPSFADADPEQQAQFARLLNRWNMQDEVLGMITPEKAARNAAAYEERGFALAGKGQWKDLLDLSDSASNAPESLRLFQRGIAARKLGRNNFASTALADAVRAGARENYLPQTLNSLDAAGEDRIADSTLTELCSNPITAKAAFHAARNRFTRRGLFSEMSAAWKAAADTVPNDPAVQDFKRRRDLLEDENVSLDETAAALEANPSDVQIRFTHTLNLLKHNRPEDALGVFHDFDVFASTLPPGDQAIAAAMMQANGLETQAHAIRRLIKPNLLTKGEFALLAPQPKP